MKKLLRFLKNYKKETVLAPLFKLLEATLELFVPIIIASIIDDGITKNNHQYILMMCGLLLILAAIGLAFSITAQYFSAKSAVGFVKDIRHALFRHIQGLSYKEQDELGSSTLITRMTSDINQVQNGLNLTLRLLLRSPFVVFGAMIMAFTIDTKIAFIFVVMIPLLAIVIFTIMILCLPLYKKVQNSLDQLTISTRENLRGVRVIRAFTRENEEIHAFQEKNDRLTSLQKFVGRISALLNPVTYVMLNIGIIILIHIGALRVNIGDLTQGQVVALYNYMSQILVELIKLADLIINVTKAIACGNRIQDVFEVKNTLISGTKNMQESEDILKMKDVSLYYNEGSEPALSNISLQIKKGETVGIIGPTGSGKSSLVNLICRFYDASSGMILLNDEPIENYDIQQLRENIGIVSQDATLFQGTIKDNMLWGNQDASDEEIYEALEIAQMKETVLQKEQQLDYFIEQGSHNLSGGQKQRLTIARAIMKKPKILILDDSSSALDFATDAALRKAIGQMDQEMTVFIVSQRTSSLQHASQILVLDNGELVGHGRHDKLLQTCPLYQDIYHLQYKEGGDYHG